MNEKSDTQQTGERDNAADHGADAARVHAWRQAQRAVMRRRRAGIDAAARLNADAAIARHLAAALKIEADVCIAVYWPLASEPDLSAWCSRQAAAGRRLALPVVVAAAAPLIFRPWSVGEALARDALDIPCPPDKVAVQPDIIVAPCVAFDATGFRLGSGGGYYDRTLADAEHRPMLVGVAYDCLKLPSIRPQPHDIPFDMIISEERVYHGTGRGA